MDLTTRPAAPGDLEFARSLHHEAYREWVVDQFGPWDEKLQDRFFEDSWNQWGYDVIRANDADCGYAAVEVADDAIHLREFAVSEPYRGLGIGAAFLRSLVETAKEAEKPLKLRAFKANSRAIALYERAGFVRVGSTDAQILFEWPD